MNEDDLYRTVGRAIAVRRNELDLTQSEVAKRVGLSRASLANIETGRQKILLHYLYKLAAVLEIPRIDALLPVAQAIKEEDAEELSIGGDPLNEKQRAEVEAFYALSEPKRKSVRARL